MKKYSNLKCCLSCKTCHVLSCVGLVQSLGLVHTARFFLIATAIPHIATNGLYRTQWKCSHCATATTSPASIQPIVSKSKLQLRIAQCERALTCKVTACECGYVRDFSRAFWGYKGPFTLLDLQLGLASAYNGLYRCYWGCRSYTVWALPLSSVQPTSCDKRNRVSRNQKEGSVWKSLNRKVYCWPHGGSVHSIKGNFNAKLRRGACFRV